MHTLVCIKEESMTHEAGLKVSRLIGANTGPEFW